MSLTEYAAESGSAIAEPLEAAATVMASFSMLPVAAIASSLTNPRKTFDPGKLQELADSIKASGVHQPVLVRPLPASRLQDTYYLRDNPKAPLPTYELVAGERRLRACKLAGVDTIPAMIKAMTDGEVLECQLIENLQRDDLAPMEEAEGYQALIEATGIDKEVIGTRIGRSRTYVYGRLKLLDLCDIARTSLRKGNIDASRALVIARIPDEALQVKALKEATRKDYQGAVPSYRAFLSWAQGNVMLRLDGARFKITDASLVPAAGSCRDCSKRTGANPDLFADVAGADVCTDPKCFHTKVEAHDAAQIRQAKENGSDVILGKQAKKLWGYEHQSIDGYVRLDKPDYRVDGKKPLSKVLGNDLPAPTLIAHPGSGELVAVLPTKVVNERLKALQLISAAAAEGDKKQKKMQDARSLLEKVEKTWRKMAIAKVHAVGSTRASMGLSVTLCQLMALRLVPSLRQEERAIYGELFGIGKVAQSEGIEAHVRARTAHDVDLVCMVLLSLCDMHYLVQYQDGKASPTPHIDAVAHDLDINLGTIKDDVKEQLKPKAKKPAAGATKKAAKPATKPAAGKAKAPSNGKAMTGPADRAVGLTVRFKADLKGLGGKMRKVGGRTGTIEHLIGDGACSVRLGTKAHETAIADWSELEIMASAAEAQAGIAAALQQLPADPVKPAPAGKKAKGAKS